MACTLSGLFNFPSDKYTAKEGVVYMPVASP